MGSTFTALLRYLTELKAQANHKVHTLAHKGEHAAHYCYLSLVFLEAHGAYGKAAGVMLVFLAVSDVFAGE